MWVEHTIAQRISKNALFLCRIERTYQTRCVSSRSLRIISAEEHAPVSALYAATRASAFAWYRRVQAQRSSGRRD